jgi:hypothetical protein
VEERLGRREVAKRLRVKDDVLDAWLVAPEDMPNGKRLALADLVQEITIPGSKK